MRVQMKALHQLLMERGLQNNGEVQRSIDTNVVRLSEKYTPYGETGHLKMARGTVYGSGMVKHNEPYAKPNYYHNAGRGKEGTAHGGLRGPKWFERMKEVHLMDILNTAAGIAGARPKRK